MTAAPPGRGGRRPHGCLTGRMRRLGSGAASVMLAAAVLVVVALGAAAPARAGSGQHPSGDAVEPALANRAAGLAALEAPVPLPTDRAPRLLLAGDSVADTLVNALATEAAGRGATLARSVHAGCGLMPGLPTTRDRYTPPWASACANAAPEWRRQVAATPADVVLVLATWDGSSRLVDGVFVDPATPDGRAAFVGMMRDLVESIAPSGSGRYVVLLAESIPARGAVTGDPSVERVVEARNHRAVLREVAQGDPGRVRVVDLGQWLCPLEAPCPEIVDGVQARADDGGHFSPEGAAWIAPRILDAIGLSPR